ncbi:MAG: cysteine-rich CWC family protein [Comamonadaceae bacterium]
MPFILAVDATRCPVCGQVNQCAIEEKRVSAVPQPPCWCTHVNFDSKLLSTIPKESRGKACLCPVCAKIKSA